MNETGYNNTIPVIRDGVHNVDALKLTMHGILIFTDNQGEN